MRTPYMSSQQLLVKTAVVRGWSAQHLFARETTHTHTSIVRAIWLNLPEEQADLKD